MISSLPKTRIRSRRNRRSWDRSTTSFERLESRELLRAAELSWADTSQLTLSFAQDGTMIAGEPSELHAMFDPIGRRSEWQSAILRGFQTWTEQTGSNVGVVPESAAKLPFGVPGPRTGDLRFGDIRIGARPLSSNVKAIAVAHNTIVSGTWSGDVIFNSATTFENLEELYRVALHEAGHVFGLENNEHPRSPMNDESRSLIPTEGDIEGVQQLHGERTVDQNEGELGNNTWRTATPLELELSPQDGSLKASTHLVYGDITTTDDVDVFSLSVPSNANGSIRIRLQTRRISLLAPALSVTNVSGDEVTCTQSMRIGGASVEIFIDDIMPQSTYFIEVAAADGTLFDIGTYSLITSFDVSTDLSVTSASLDKVATQRVRDFTQKQLQAMLADTYYKIDDTENVVDSILTAVNLPQDRGFGLYARYEGLGTIASERDVDYYVFRAAPNGEKLRPFLNLSVRSLQLGGLIPQVSVLDQFGNDIQAKTLVNGGGEVVLQAAVLTGQDYYIRVGAAAQHGHFDQGNYRVSLTFVETPIETSSFAQGGVSPDSPVPRVDVSAVRDLQGVNENGVIASHNDADVHVDSDEANKSKGVVVYVATPQIFHFILFAAQDNIDTHDAILATIFNESDELVHFITAGRGETRTSNSVLLMPGTYTMRFDRLESPLETPVNVPLRFELRGVTISDPFGTDPDDPTGAPFFECPHDPSAYCYPGGIESTDPFLWDEFLESLPEIPDLETAELIALLLGDWWAWYWQQNSTYTPPLAIEDTYAVPLDGQLVVSEVEGVLQNDVFDPFFSESIAWVVDDVEHGVLVLEEDGSFTYTPPPAYQGIVSFTYEAFDFRHISNQIRVEIQVGNVAVPGDFSGDGVTDIVDVDLLCSAIRSQDTAEMFDLDQNGAVEHADLTVLIEDILGTTAGDANLNGHFDSEDFVLVFIENEYLDQLVGNSTWATGDWNCDGEFTPEDIVTAFIAGGYTAPGAQSAESNRTSSERSAALNDLVWAALEEDERRRRRRR